MFMLMLNVLLLLVFIIIISTLFFHADVHHVQIFSILLFSTLSNFHLIAAFIFSKYDVPIDDLIVSTPIACGFFLGQLGF